MAQTDRVRSWPQVSPSGIRAKSPPCGRGPRGEAPPRPGWPRLTVLSLLAVSRTLLSARSAANSPTMFSSVTATTSSVRFLWGSGRSAGHEGPQDLTAPSGFRDLSPLPELPPGGCPLTFSGMDGRRPESGATKQESWWRGEGGPGAPISQRLALPGVPNTSGSPVLLTGPLFPGAGGGMLCALETVTPLPWERGVAVWPSGLGYSLPIHLRSEAQGLGATYQLH